jgi:hypothetical protein
MAATGACGSSPRFSGSGSIQPLAIPALPDHTTPISLLIASDACMKSKSHTRRATGQHRTSGDKLSRVEALKKLDGFIAELEASWKREGSNGRWISWSSSGVSPLRRARTCPSARPRGQETRGRGCPRSYVRPEQLRRQGQSEKSDSMNTEKPKLRILMASPEEQASGMSLCG